jgi:hypothetical protein
MSRLTDTKRAFDRISGLLDQEILKRGSNVKELERYRETLDVAFYLLGWAQFEHLARTRATEIIEEQSRSKALEGHAWLFLHQHFRGLGLRKKLDIIFHADQKTRATLDADYDLRNEAAHNYKTLPRQARQISIWLKGLEELVTKFGP